MAINRWFTAISCSRAHSNGPVIIYNGAITLSWWVDTSFMACVVCGNHTILGLDNLVERISLAYSPSPVGHGSIAERRSSVICSKHGMNELASMKVFKLEKLGPRRKDGPPADLSVMSHPDQNFDAAFQSAIQIVRTTFEVDGVSGFRLSDSHGRVREWFLGEDDA